MARKRTGGGVSEANCHRRACKVSVIVPVHHVGKYINRCIDSLLKQTLREIEIICICERDDSAFNTLCGYAGADGRVHVLEKANTGVSAARNAGIKAAKGTYLAFVDADDWIERHALQVLYAAARRYRAQIVAYGIWPTVEPKGDKRRVFGCTPKRNVLYHNNGMMALFYEHGSRPYIGNKFYDRRFLMEHHILFDESIDIGEDQLLQFEAFGKAGSICFLREKLYHYDMKRSNSAMNVCEQRHHAEDENFKLLQAIMEQKKRCGIQYDKDYAIWILQCYGDIVNEGVEHITKNRQHEIIAIQRYLNELSADGFVKDLPKTCQILCRRFLRYPKLPDGYQRVSASYKADDQYRAEQVQGLYQTITVAPGLSAKMRRLHEALAFHEFRHLVVRVLERLGLY